MSEKLDKLIDAEYDNMLNEALDITIGGQQDEETTPRVKMDITKTLDGDYLIQSHNIVDVMVDPDESNIKLFPKDSKFDADRVESIHTRFIDFMRDRGVIDPGSVEGGNAFGTVTMSFPVNEDNDTSELDAVLYAISGWIEDERPAMEFAENYFDQMLDKLLRPDKEDSTDLGEVPHSDDKGSIDQTTFPNLTYYNFYE